MQVVSSWEVNDVSTHSQVPLIPKGEVLYKGQGSLELILRILPTTLDHGKSNKVMAPEREEPASFLHEIHHIQHGLPKFPLVLSN